MKTPRSTYHRKQAISFFQRVHELSRVPGIKDPLTATIVFEALGVDTMSNGAAGLTPAILERSQGLPYETARRRLNALTAEGVLVRTSGGYFVPPNSPYWEAFDTISEELLKEAARLTTEASGI